MGRGKAPKGLLTENQRQKLQEKEKTLSVGKRKALKEARASINPALEDIDFLLKLHGLDFRIDQKLIINLMESYLDRPKFNITEKERMRVDLPRGEKKKWVDLKKLRIADYNEAVKNYGENSKEAKSLSVAIKGISDALSSFKNTKIFEMAPLRDKTEGNRGAPLMKRLGDKYILAYKFAQKLYSLQEQPWAGPLVITDKGNGKVEVKGQSNLRSWLSDFGLFDELFDFSELFPDLPLEKKKLLQKIIKQGDDLFMKRIQEIQAQAKEPKHVVFWLY